jgi:MoxR-like ATPase
LSQSDFAKSFASRYGAQKVIVGHEDTIRKVLIAFAGGSALEGVPGLGKRCLSSLSAAPWDYPSSGFSLRRT